MAATIPLIIAGVASAVVSSALAPDPQQPQQQGAATAAAPTVAPVPTMPVADDKPSAAPSPASWHARAAPPPS